MMADGAREEDPRDQLDALRAPIRHGDLSSGERDQLVFGIAVADWRASAAARDFPGDVAVQRALSAESWATAAAQLHVMLGGSLNGDASTRAPERAWS